MGYVDIESGGFGTITFQPDYFFHRFPLLSSFHLKSIRLEIRTKFDLFDIFKPRLQNFIRRRVVTMQFSVRRQEIEIAVLSCNLADVLIR